MNIGGFCEEASDSIKIRRVANKRHWERERPQIPLRRYATISIWDPITHRSYTSTALWKPTTSLGPNQPILFSQISILVALCLRSSNGGSTRIVRNGLILFLALFIGSTQIRGLFISDGFQSDQSTDKSDQLNECVELLMFQEFNSHCL